MEVVYVTKKDTALADLVLGGFYSLHTGT
jgi:hypothetical protein